MRKTKIICTIGPASENEETLKKMCLAGMNVARLNFSHGTHEEQQKKIDLIKKVRTELNLPIAILLDTKGPEYRIRTFKDGKVHVNAGDKFTFTVDEVEGDEKRVSVNYKGLVKDLSVGDKILVNNGLVVFEVEELKGSNANCVCLVGGDLSNRKSMSFPNKVMTGPFLSDADKQDLLFGIQNGVDFVAASFVSNKQNVLDMRAFLDENGGADIEIIAKIENQSGVDNAEEILEACGGLMVARGDLGVEVPFVELPAIQKQLIHKCRLLGKRVVTATEMLESMIQNPRPTRAEISDVANAVYDGTSAIMLSGESAAGGGRSHHGPDCRAHRAAHQLPGAILQDRVQDPQQPGCHFPRHLRHGHRCGCQGDRGLLRLRQDRRHGQPLPLPHRHCGHDHQREGLEKTEPELGRYPCAGR